MLGRRFLMDLDSELQAEFDTDSRLDSAPVPAGRYGTIHGPAGLSAPTVPGGTEAADEAGKDARGLDRWVEEQMFEEDLRAVLAMMRPNRYERLMGWAEYRTGGRHFRATISWDKEFERTAGGQPLNVPHIADVLEAILVGSVKADAPLTDQEVGEMYRDIVAELYRRVDALPGAGD